jgi:hypothetical protein
MTAELTIPLISSAVALISAGLALWGSSRTARLSAELQALNQDKQRRIDSEKALSRYREPLARAAYDLQSRLYNILKKNLISKFFESGSERERSYVVDSTVFLVAQYFAWTEIIRRDIQYIDQGQDIQTRRLARLLDDINTIARTDRFDRSFRIFAGEQRAIGERMIRDGPRGAECLGYAGFLDHLSKAPDPLLEYVRQDVRHLNTQHESAAPRLVALQNAVIDLLAFLDPDFIRFPENRRTKVVK